MTEVILRVSSKIGFISILLIAGLLFIAERRYSSSFLDSPRSKSLLLKTVASLLVSFLIYTALLARFHGEALRYNIIIGAAFSVLSLSQIVLNRAKFRFGVIGIIITAVWSLLVPLFCLSSFLASGAVRLAVIGASGFIILFVAHASWFFAKVLPQRNVS